MTDEIRIYHVDDPNDAPERRLSTLPTISPFVPTSLPQYVIQPVASSLLTAMRDYWYLAYQQGIAAQKQQQGIAAQRQQQLLQQQRQAEAAQAAAVAAAASSHHLYNQQHQQQQLKQEQEQQQRQQQQQQQQQQLVQRQLEQMRLEPRQPDQRQVKQEQEQEQEQEQQQLQQQQRHQHIKKPLNPFMIYMQKRRPEIVKQGIIKESAAINQMLGQQWRKLTRDEQEPYYKLAEQERILHAQKYPGWSARDNYANQKKKKKSKLKSISLNGLDQSDKKCRARFGLNNMASWCKPCRRKKKCIYNIPNGYKTDNHHHHTHHLHHHDNHLNHHHHHHSVNNIID